MGDERHAQNILDVLQRGGAVGAKLDAATLAAPAGVDLRLDDILLGVVRPMNLLDGLFGLRDIVDSYTVLDRNPVVLEQFLGLVFVYFHILFPTCWTRDPNHLLLISCFVLNLLFRNLQEFRFIQRGTDFIQKIR